MPALFRCESATAKKDAQRNLIGRTHYVDDDSLRFHKSRIVDAEAALGGLFFAIVTNDALDYENSCRGFRYVIFDVFGTVVSRTELAGAFKHLADARAALRDALASIDVRAVMLAAIAEAEAIHAEEMQQLRNALPRLPHVPATHAIEEDVE